MIRMVMLGDLLYRLPAVLASKDSYNHNYRIPLCRIWASTTGGRACLAHVAVYLSACSPVRSEEERSDVRSSPNIVLHLFVCYGVVRKERRHLSGRQQYLLHTIKVYANETERCV